MNRAVPTNHSMMMLRVANQAWGAPNANKDWVAMKVGRRLGGCAQAEGVA
jgi:hypothetical protein